MTIIIKTKKADSFWRCGTRFTRENQEFANDRFSADQIRILKAEPMLEVLENVPDVPDEKPVKKGKNKG